MALVFSLEISMPESQRPVKLEDLGGTTEALNRHDWYLKGRERFVWFWSQVIVFLLLLEQKKLREQITATNRGLEEARCGVSLERRRAALAGWLPPDSLRELEKLFETFECSPSEMDKIKGWIKGHVRL